MLEKKVLGFLSVVLFALCLVIPAKAQVSIPPGSGTDTGLGGGNAITGMVLLSTGQRLERRISIRLQTMTRGDRVAITDEYGKFAFVGLVSGDYTIVIDREKDFQPFSQVVTIIQPRGFPAQTYNVNLRLTPKAGTAGKPGVLNAEFANVPPRALAFYTKALEQAQAGKNKEAVEQLKQAISEYPNFMIAFNELGVQYLKLNQLENADEAFQAALKIVPDAFGPLTNRGIASFMMKRY